ncbi:MAG: MFS transporter [Gammaproteobacteria bacterium]|jgi:MFS family permease|nr:MFS transporter [Gammaproteobacteria bacterium]MBT6073512.1 MFS transporter [Gammaproteobacteria bacterium]
MKQNNPLNNVTFAKLFTAQIVALVGTGLSTIGLSLLAYDMSGSNAGAVLGIALACKMIAYIFFSPIIGGLVHRFARKKFMIVMDIFRALIVLLMPFVSEIWHIYILIFLLNLFSAGFKPVFQAVIPDILEDEKQYGKALSYSRLAYDLEVLLSPTLAGIALLYFSFSSLFILNSFAFVVSAMIIVITLIPKTKTVERTGNLWNEITFGVVSYLKTPRLRSLLILYVGIASASSMIIVNTVIYVKDYLGGLDSTVAIFFALSGSGSMIAALIYPSLSIKLENKTIIQGGVSITAMSLAIMSLELSMIPSLICWFFTGLGLSLSQIPAGIIVNMSSNPKDRTAYFSAQFALSHICWFFGYLAAGQLALIFGFSFTSAFLASIITICLIYSILFWPKEESTTLKHEHKELIHAHTHLHEDEHHKHHHEFKNDDKEHEHEHKHLLVTHSHPFNIDIHHQNWPKG